MMGQNKEFYQKIFHERDYLSVLSDTELQTEDGWSFNVHRVTLAGKSRFFHDLFCNFPNEREPTLIPKFRGETLNEILYFIYTDSVAFNKHNFLDIIIASDFLQIDKLYIRAKKCAESLLSTENCLRVYVTSRKINEVRLRELSFRIIQTNFERLKNEAEFAEFSVEDLMKILKDNSLQATGENVIWEFILEWVCKDPPNRFKEVCYLLKCLKLEDIDESLANEIIQSDIVAKNPYFGGLKEVALQKLEGSLDALKSIISSCPESPEISLSNTYNRRLPQCVHVIICPTILGEYFRIYITYDEKLDLWKKLREFRGLMQFYRLHILRGNIYVFNDFAMNGMRFNLYEQEWREIENAFEGIQHHGSLSVAVGKNIFFITNDRVGYDGNVKVRIYNTENGLWSDAMPVLRLSHCEAVSLLNKIFLIQNTENGASTVFIQVYDEKSNSWFSITPPSVDRVDFYPVAYHKKLYIIGGTGLNGRFCATVEVFDAARNEWEIIDNLPFSIHGLSWRFSIDSVGLSGYICVSIIKDQLFVFLYGHNGEKFNSLLKKFVLNGTSWVEPEKPIPVEICELVQKGSPIFHTVYDKQIISALVKENRLQETIFEKSPFQ